MKKLNLLIVLIIIFTWSCSKDKDNEFDGDTGTFTDKRDGQVYNWVRIGEQIWMVDNLKATKYNDGTPIPLVTDNDAWINLNSPGYCWYDNDEVTYKDTYGALYNWYAVNNPKLSPTGWHVPSDVEWTVLTDYLGGTGDAGGKLKEAGTTHWISPNTGATNESGFTALPGGFRVTPGVFNRLEYYAYLWSSTGSSSYCTYCRSMIFDDDDVEREEIGKIMGLSVRCLKD